MGDEEGAARRGGSERSLFSRRLLEASQKGGGASPSSLEMMGLSPYKIKKKQLLSEYEETIRAGDAEGISKSYRAKLEAKHEKTLQDIQKLDEENPEEVRAFQTYVAEVLNEEKRLKSGEERLDPVSSIGGMEATKATPPLRRLQRMLEESKKKFGDLLEASSEGEEEEQVSQDEVTVVSEVSPSNSGGGFITEIGPILDVPVLGVGPVLNSVVARHSGCHTGVNPVLKSVGGGPALSWKNILIGQGSRAASIAGDRSEKMEKVESKPGARSNVQLKYVAFEPGSPVNNLVADAETVEKLNNCIVGHFLGARMDFYDVRKEMFNQWESCGLEKMWCTDNGIYLFKFKGTNRIDEILYEAHCHVFGKVMFLKRWHQMQKLAMEAVYKVPIWVKIYELPFEFWLGDSLGENLSKIASRIGRPLYIDTATEKGMRLSYARVCVEIDVSALQPNSINIEFGDESVEVKVKYQWVPQKCEKCGAFGHKESYCPVNPKTEELGEKKSSKAKASTGYNFGGRTKGVNSGKVGDKDWKVVQKGKWESRINSIKISEEEFDDQEGNELVCSDKHGKKAQVKGNLAKDSGHLKSDNSFAVLQSIQGDTQGMNLNRGKKEVVAIGASRVQKTNGGDVEGGVCMDIFGDVSDKVSGSGRNPEEDGALFDAFVNGRDVEGLGIATPKPKKIWTENDFPVDWGKSRRRKTEKAANLAGLVQNDPP